MTYSQMGLVLGAWQLIYIGTASPLGTLVDRLGIRRSLGTGIFIVWLSLVLRGLAADFFTLFLAVALFGVGGPLISIGAPKVASVWFEGNERGIAAGIYATGSIGGTVFALATAGSIVMSLTGSWRGVSVVYGAIVLVIMIAWWAFARDAPLPPSEESGQSASESTPAHVVLWELLHLRNVQLILLVAGATFMMNHGLGNWLPTLLQEGGMTLSQAGFWTAVGTAAGVIGLLSIPRVARHGHRALTLGFLLAASAATTAGLPFLRGPTLITTLIVSTIVRNPMMPVLTLILMETPGVGALRMGAAAGLFFAAAEVGGFGGPFLLGFLHDSTGSLTFGILLLAAMAASLILMTPFIQERRAERAPRREWPHKGA